MMVTQSNHIGDMAEIMRHEFKNIGLNLTNINVNHDSRRHQIMGQHSPQAYSHGYPIMDIHFTCSEDQMDCLKTFIKP